MAIDELRAANERTARAYDEVFYDPTPPAEGEPNLLLGLARLYGCGGAVRDVLDLGCGTGVQLARVAPTFEGRLVGVDISPRSCALANERLTPFGARAEARCLDLMDADPGEFGQFDLIYLVGTLYVTPPAVRARLLATIGQCLRPRGVVLVSLYTGPLHAARELLHRAVRSGVRSSDPKVMVGYARSYLANLESTMSDQTPAHALTLAGLRMTARAPDTVLYHEIYSDFSALLCSEIERALAPFGISFLTYTAPAPFSVLPTSEQRAVGADVYDGALGNYRYAVFGRPLADAIPDPRAEGVRWSSPLRRRAGSEGYGAPAGYVDGGSGAVTVGNALTQAMLDTLTGDEISWAEMLAKGRALLHMHQAGPGDEALAASDILNLWRHGLARVRAAV